ncbi:hypothetical protein [Rufibacter aurantiacus]|uniref:hypothetical protein n=1 Tax=Rufibacter aurantiacus TaxID=2817374 RepID=UPI001B3173B1|nr:hypothetical protein [Rufibacter aurantiacus]
MEVIGILFTFSIVIWILRAAYKSITAAQNGKQLNSELSKASDDILNLLLQRSPDTAIEKHKALKQRTEYFIQYNMVKEDEYPKLLPAYSLFLENYDIAEKECRKPLSTYPQNAANLAVQQRTTNQREKNSMVASLSEPKVSKPKRTVKKDTHTSEETSASTQKRLSKKPILSHKTSINQDDVAADVHTANYIVGIVPNKDSGALFTAYPRNPEFGYIHLSQTDMLADDEWLRFKTRSTLLRARVEELALFINTFAKGGKLPGKIVVREFLESQLLKGELPEQFASRVDQKVDYEVAIAPFIRRSGKDGPELTLGGQRILRFTNYVIHASDEDFDEIIHPDNLDAVTKLKNSQHRASAPLVQGTIPAKIQDSKEEKVWNLDRITVIDTFSLKIVNPFYLAFKDEHDALKLPVCYFFVSLVHQMNLITEKESLMWLKTLLFSLELPESKTIAEGVTLSPMFEEAKCGEAIFSPLEIMNEKQGLLFTWMLYKILQDHKNQKGTSEYAYYKKMLSYLPSEVLQYSFLPHSVFLDKVTHVTKELVTKQ